MGASANSAGAAFPRNTEDGSVSLAGPGRLPPAAANRWGGLLPPELAYSAGAPAALGSWGDSSSPHPALLPGLESVLHPSDPQAVPIPLPGLGTTFLGFHLLTELGRGTFGRVYLARQGDLADRFVALKVSAEGRAESEKLARLQHTHIVPVHSVHQAGLLQAVCMPYFGSATLADVLGDIGSRPTPPESGRGLTSTVQQRRSRTRAAAGLDLPPRSQAPLAPSAGAPAEPSPEVPLSLRRLEGFSYVHAVLWIGARLADGLAHAHDRGILHRDLKPANVLLTDDGLPMLLDFNLSGASPTAPPEGLPAGTAHSVSHQVGGTLPYMAPEHLAAFACRPAPFGDHPPVVDARSDVYSLGIILHELLTGRHPFPRRVGAVETVVPLLIQDRLGGVPPVAPANPAVTPAALAILRRATHPDPALRYQSARQLQDDLECQLASLPLRHTPEPSWAERGGKWLRRHPSVLSAGTVVGLAGALIFALILALAVRGDRLARLQARDRLASFRDDLASARLLLAGRPADADLRAEGIARARQGLARFHGDRAGEGGHAGLPPPGGLDLLTPGLRGLAPEDRRAVTFEIGELLLLLAGATDDPVEALALTDRAATCYQPDHAPRAFWAQRAELGERLGRPADARIWRARAEATPPRDARDLYYLARGRLLGRGQAAEAIPLLRESLAADPSSFAAWFLLGNCYLEGAGDAATRDRDAARHFTACVALRPDFHGAWFNRGIAHLRLRAFADAEDDFTRALRLRPGLAEARVLRALAREGAGDDRGALSDLDRVLEPGPAQPTAPHRTGPDSAQLPAPPTRAWFVRERVRRRLKDEDGARLDRAEGLRRTPTDEEGWVARGVARVKADPKGALEDFRRAALLNPRSQAGLHNQAHVLSECLGQTEAAVTVLDRVLALYPDFAPALAGRAVLHARLGRRDQAHDDARAVLTRARGNTSPEILFQVAGAYALTSRDQPADRDEALRLLGAALRGGFGHDLLESDDDLALLRRDPRFRDLARAARTIITRAGP